MKEPLTPELLLAIAAAATEYYESQCYPFFGHFCIVERGLTNVK
jgi:hypothetical protein